MGKTGPKLKWNLNEALKMKNLGLSYSQIARELGIKPITIQCYFLKHYGKLNYKTNTAKNNELDQIQQEVLFGSLLGDGNLRITNGSINASGKIEHGIKQLEYLKFKRNIFLNICSDIKVSKRIDKRFNKQREFCYIRFNNNPALNNFYTMFYTPKKNIPINLELLSPLSIAIWYMDDGIKATTGGYYFSTNSFKKEDVERLSNELNIRYNLKTSLHNKGKEQYMIYIHKSSSETFENIVEQYIIPSMRYKFHSLLTGINGESPKMDNPVPSISLKD